MPRARSPERDKAYEIWRSSSGKKPLKDIAEELGVSDAQIRQWKRKDKWSLDSSVINHANNHVTKRKSNTTRKAKAVIETALTTPENEELTERQRLFCLYYLKNFNATLAYLKAYGCSYDTASANGCRLLGIAKVRDEIETQKKIKRQTIMVGEDDIVERYMRIAFADMTDFAEFGMEDVPLYDAEGQQVMLDDGSMATTKRNYLNFKGHEQVDGGLICEISLGKSGTKVKLEDRQKALSWLADYFNMNPQNKHKQWFDKQRLELEREKAKGPDIPQEPLIIRPVYGRVSKDGD